MRDIIAFIKYIASIYGVLAGVTAAFPLADVFLKVIPLPVDPYGQSTASVAVPITSLISLFIIFYSFVQRDEVVATMSPKAIRWVALGLISLMIFFLLKHFEYPLRTWLFPRLDSTSDYVLMLVGIVPFYTISFVSFTRAFTILALIEFKRHHRR